MTHATDALLPLRTRILLALRDGSGPMNTRQIAEAIGASSKVTVPRVSALMKELRARQRVAFRKEAVGDLSLRAYTLTANGQGFLAELLTRTAAAAADDLIVLPTDAMQGEEPLILRTAALPGQACRAPNSVFALCTGGAP